VDAPYHPYPLAPTSLHVPKIPDGTRRSDLHIRGLKSGVLFLPVYYNPIRQPIVPVISAIWFLTFTSEKLGKSGNYARFFVNYARNPGPDRASGTPPGSCHRRRVQSGKVLLSPRLFTALRTYGLSDTHLTNTQNPRRCPSVEMCDFQEKQGFFRVPTSCSLAQHPIGGWKEPKRTF